MQRVSIIVPLYNAEKTIDRAIGSLVQQSYEHIEIILVNDGSTDATSQLCEKWTQKDPRIKYIATDNGGVSSARNAGLKNATGTYIMFLDADDSMEPFMVSEMVSLMQDQIDLGCCGYHIAGAAGEVQFVKTPEQGEAPKQKAYREIETLNKHVCFNMLWNKIFRSSVIKQNNIWMNISVSMGEDLLFVLEYIEKMNGGIRVADKALYYYTLSASGLQTKFDVKSKLRIDQLKELKRLYIEMGYPMNGFFLEEIRTAYIILLENSQSRQSIAQLLSSDLCREIRNKKILCSGRFKAMYMLIKINSVQLTLFAIRVFRTVKKLQGQLFEWNNC